MGIISKCLKYAGCATKTVARYAFGNGNEVISAARKAATPKGASKIGSIFNKNVVKAGWQALKKDVVKTSKSNKGIWSSIKSFGKSLISKPKAGIRLATMQAAKAGKKAGFFTKAAGALKGLGKVLKKMPIIGTVVTIGFEIPEIYKAFTHKDGGAWEGIKQIGKSAVKIASGATLSAIGTVIGGPVGGVLGYIAGEWIADKLLGGSFSDNHPEAEESANDQEQSAAIEEDAVEPDAAEQNVVEPDVVEQDAVEPDVAEPDEAEPDVVEQDAVEQDAVEPDEAEPDEAEPDEVEQNTQKQTAQQPSYQQTTQVGTHTLYTNNLYTYPYTYASGTNMLGYMDKGLFGNHRLNQETDVKQLFDMTGIKFNYMG